MDKIYVLRRSVSDFDWEEPAEHTLAASTDCKMLDEIADELYKKHANDDRSYNYWVVEVPVVGSKEELYGYFESTFDFLEDT